MHYISSHWAIPHNSFYEIESSLHGWVNAYEIWMHNVDVNERQKVSCHSGYFQRFFSLSAFCLFFLPFFLIVFPLRFVNPFLLRFYRSFFLSFCPGRPPPPVQWRNLVWWSGLARRNMITTIAVTTLSGADAARARPSIPDESWFGWSRWIHITDPRSSIDTRSHEMI